MSSTAVRTPAHLSMGAMCFRDRPFPNALAAAANSGFAGVGLTVGQCVTALERGIALGKLHEQVVDAGLRVAELELIRLGEDGPIRHANSLVEDLARTLQPDRVHVAAFAGELPQIENDFAAVCASLPDVRVAIEFMPYSRVPDLAEALRIVEVSGATNAGIVLDVVHFFRSGCLPGDLTPAHLRRVASVQLSDVAVRPRAVSLAREARHLRTYPGHGTLDLVGFLRQIGADTDVLPPVSIEPISDALESLPLPVVAEEIMFSTLATLAAAGWFGSDEAFVRSTEMAAGTH
jgi:sugar phosphate isomerase/epimerase